ncbi:MAG: site-specific integrase [bacterium]
MRARFFMQERVLKSGKSLWYFREWDEERAVYKSARSTGVEAKGKRSEAVARDKAQELCGRSKPKKTTLLVDYLIAFWSPTSPYLRGRELSLGRPVSTEYIQQNARDVVAHVAGYTPFAKLRLDGLTHARIEDWRLSLADQGMKPRRINQVMAAVQVPLKWAFSRAEVPVDPFARIKPLPRREGIRGSLTRAEVSMLIDLEVKDPRKKLALMLMALAGLRRGEVAGLRWGDIDAVLGILNVTHNHVRMEGDKLPKLGSSRRLPIGKYLLSLLESTKSHIPYTGPADYVFQTLGDKPEGEPKPYGESFYRNAFISAMGAIGVDAEEREARRLCVHSLRHSFVTLSREAGIPDFVVQSMAGHSSMAMTERYSHAGVIDFNEARAKLEASIGKAASL